MNNLRLSIHLLKVTEDSFSNSVINVNSQPVFKTFLLTQLHLNKEEGRWVHGMTDRLTMFYSTVTEKVNLQVKGICDSLLPDLGSSSGKVEYEEEERG